jgi:hypothetical protein
MGGSHHNVSSVRNVGFTQPYLLEKLEEIGFVWSINKINAET